MIEEIPITCPKCGREFKKKVGGLQKKFACPKCKTRFDGKDLARGLKDANKDIEKLTRDIGGLFK